MERKYCLKYLVTAALSGQGKYVYCLFPTVLEANLYIRTRTKKPVNAYWIKRWNSKKAKDLVHAYA